MCFDKLFKKEPEKKNPLEILLKIFLIVGTLAGICVILKYAYDKYKNSGCCLCGDDDDDLESLDDILDECECCCDDCQDCDTCEKTCEDCAEEKSAAEDTAADDTAEEAAPSDAE